MKKTFTHLAEAWYREAVLEQLPKGKVDDIILSISDGTTDCEIIISWYDIGSNLYAPRIEMFADAWRAFEMVPELFAMLAQLHDVDIQPAGMIMKLKEIGFEDVTPQTSQETASQVY